MIRTHLIVSKTCPVHGEKSVRDGQTICGIAPSLGTVCSKCGGKNGKHSKRHCRGKFETVWGEACKYQLHDTMY